MRQEQYTYESAVRVIREKGSAGHFSPGVSSGVESSKCCAYNKTRERFLSVKVEAADFSADQLEPRLASLTQGSDTALWVIPFRGISATMVRIPVDLVYLDEDLVVLAAIDSFPLSQVSPSCKPAASVLALPANTVIPAGTSAGDQLIICSPLEMTQHLQHLRDELGSDIGHDSGTDRIMRRTPDNVLKWEDHSGPKEAGEDPGAEVIPAQPFLLPKPEPAPPPEVAKPAEKNSKASKNWLQRIFSPDPPEPRKAQREALPGLVAYFFTGETPLAHGIRDISPTGLYVFTDQRWYIGTVVRLTLTDIRQPTLERSIAVNATVVRWGNDGVGLQFILQDRKNPGRNNSTGLPELAEGVSKEKLEEFMQRFRKDAR